MADFDSSLPVRTENAGDVIAKIADATTPSQQLAVDASGRITTKIETTSGGTLTATGTALDVNATGTVAVIQTTSPWVTKDQADGPVSPGTVASFSELIGGQFNSTLPTLTNTQQAAIQVDSSGRIILSPASAASSSFVTVTNLPTTVDTNYGTVGGSTIRTASQLGNATGAADFNYGTVGSQTLRTASEIGNATGAANFGAGATGAQTLRVEANQGAANATPWNINIADVSGATTSALNPLFVEITLGATGSISAVNPLPVVFETGGTPVNDFKDAASIAAGASNNHDYTVTAGKTLTLKQVESSASGKAKMLLAVETGVATNVFTSYFTQFNSTATSDMSVILQAPIAVAAGVRVRVTMSNRDNQAQDLYSTICGTEL